ncbi:TonB_C domain-containing protein [Nitrospira defluvii]|uniref:TonB_C domain-containing protein n=2 Tax=Nitrospira defluvii TaxID=330214 RepID=A0ABM8RAC9_9BACT|nr:TonB_C domain-containing protein [Nitrospira defluvii]
MSSHSPLASMGAWTFSLALHGISLGAALVLATEFSVIPREHPFRWEVSIVSAPADQTVTSDVPSQATVSSVPPVSASPEASPRLVMTANHSARTVMAPIAKRAVTSDQGTLPSLYDEPTASQLTPLNAAAPDKASTDPEQPVQNPGTDTLADPSPSDLPVPTAAIAVLPPPPIEAAVPSNLAMEPAVPETLRLVNRPAPQAREAIVSRAFMPDFGWLAQMLFAEIEQAKRYPAIAKRQRWQGSVLLQARVHDDGRLSDIAVVEPSGHEILDLDAIALLERASPVSLKYPLGQPYVVVHIPIGYRLE